MNAKIATSFILQKQKCSEMSELVAVIGFFSLSERNKINCLVSECIKELFLSLNIWTPCSYFLNFSWLYIKIYIKITSLYFLVLNRRSYFVKVYFKSFPLKWLLLFCKWLEQWVLLLKSIFPLSVRMYQRI